jgi:hypothetical protein
VAVTNAKSQQPAGKTARHSRNADLAGDECGDVCELFLAELRDRRVRLRKLLQLVRIEVARRSAVSAPVRPRARCGS